MNAPRRPVWVLYLALFAYLLTVRTHGICQQFWLMGEQVRDWRIAMGPFSELPLVGTPSTAGGTTFGPVYYWVLWLIRVTLAPLFDNLPHAGGIGLSLMQSAADVLLVHALARRLESAILATVVVLFAATTPYDMALTATIWNPPLAVALSKVTIAIVLLQGEWSLARTGAVAAVAWLSVQAHMGSIFVAAACVLWMVVQPILSGQSRRAFEAARATVEIVVLLQVPYVVHHWFTPSASTPSAVSGSLWHAAEHPADLRIVESGRALAAVIRDMIFAPWSPPFIGILIALAALAVLWLRRDRPVLLAVSVGPLLLTLLGFAMWQGRLGQHYWYLPVVFPAVLTLALVIDAIASRHVRLVASSALLLVAILSQPSRCNLAWRIHRLPQYGPLARGSRQVAAQMPQVRSISAPFLPPGTDPDFLYEVLGGHIVASSPVVAHIDSEGHVQYQRVR